MTGWGAYLLATLIAIGVVDLRSLRIPDALSLPLIAAGLLRAVLDDGVPVIGHLLGAGLGYASLAGFGAIYFRLRGREGLGLGDAKLFAAAGAWLGWTALPSVLAIASVAGLAYALATLVVRRNAQFAFGPWLALAIWLCWLRA